MKELRFHRALYPGEAVDAAIHTFERWATFERESSSTHWIVRLTAGSPAAEHRIAGEISNFALGLTVRRGVPDGPDEPGAP
ncbi:MAG: HxsD-like protein [Myxococcota bacterium]